MKKSKYNVYEDEEYKKGKKKSLINLVVCYINVIIIGTFMEIGIFIATILTTSNILFSMVFSFCMTSVAMFFLTEAMMLIYAYNLTYLKNRLKEKNK